MNRYILLVSLIAFAACTPMTQDPSVPRMHDNHANQTAGASLDLNVQDQSSDAEIAFAVLAEQGNVFMEYGISHTKEMHLIVVRDDLQHFQHLHPERDTAGVWRIPFAAPAGGNYWFYADFVDTNDNTYTIRFDRAVAGDPGPHGMSVSSAAEKTVDGYRISFQPQVEGDAVSFTYDIRDAQGNRPKLEEYLGATGHSVLISPSGDFIHTHPSEEGNTPVFTTSKPSDNFYRVFTQFKINGTVLVVDFDWQVTSS